MAVRQWVLHVAMFAMMPILALTAEEKNGEGAAADDAEARETKVEVDFHLYMKGRRVYEKQCVWCHGRTGRGNGEWAKGVKDQPRNFRKGVFKFRSTRCGCLPTDGDLERTIRSGIPGTMMPTFKDMPEGDLKAVVYYVKSLSPRWKDPKALAKAEKLPEQPAWFGREKQLAPHVAQGREVFMTHCAACHGLTAKGDGPGSKGLKDVWGFDVSPANLTSRSHKSGKTPEDLFRTVALGLDGTPMAGYRDAQKDASIWDLVAFIQSVEVEAKEE
jgi:mono/diheme cytochrome c family protein